MAIVVEGATPVERENGGPDKFDVRTTFGTGGPSSNPPKPVATGLTLNKRH